MAARDILIVEDEDSFSDILRIWLMSLGYQSVAIASTGPDALKLARVNPPEIILMDIRLGGDMDGIDTAWELHKQLGLRVIYVTAYADQATVERAKSTSPYGYLVKPFTQKDLETALERAQKMKQIEGALRSKPKLDTDAMERLEQYRKTIIAQNMKIIELRKNQMVGKFNKSQKENE
jgi:DNA-binding NtrC family response regulator